uniref:Uncharacterized protein n=1 Tax=Coccidioides posadasii RMSCC 3488 TaxID=454284 RepID=A0A0J6FEP4_COCPO|nr:hypothetical protein CPAG_03718 [Coccidioides posadasii RMSCC 3488]
MSSECPPIRTYSDDDSTSSRSSNSFHDLISPKRNGICSSIARMR